MKNLKTLILFLFQFVTIGLAAALVVLFMKPELLQHFRPVVEVRQNAPVEPQPVSTPVQPSEPYSYASAVQLAAPAVVNIFTAKVVARQTTAEDLLRYYFDGVAPESSRVETSLGSGVIMTDKGHIITNNHVISGAQEIQILLSDGRNAPAMVIGTDPETDIAILKIDLDSLPTMTLGDSAIIQVGDVALAIGNPFGVGQTVTQGIISATGRKRLGLNTFENFIQTDAAINPGNSGGALINPRGELIAINSAIFSKTGGSQGIGFAIPINLARDVMTQIIERGHVVRGWLGVKLANIPDKLSRELGLKEPFGVVITDLFEDGPALKAGLLPGDVLLTINDKQIFDARNLLDSVSKLSPGSEVILDGIRDGRRFKADMKVTQRPVVNYRTLRR